MRKRIFQWVAVFMVTILCVMPASTINGAVITEEAQVAEAVQSEKLLITPTQQDIQVIPDKYNTGCKGDLTVPETIVDDKGKTTWNVNDVIFVPSGSGDSLKRVMDYHYRNKEIVGEVLFEGIDFSDIPLAVYNEGPVERKIHVVFKNCKFSQVSTGATDCNLSYEFIDCTFIRFYGSNSTFKNCKFGGSTSDGMVPFRNVEVNDCFFGDMNHMITGGEVHTDGTQIYGKEGVDAYNIHFNNCRFELPALKMTGSTASINACIMLQLEFSSGSDMSFRNCTLNGGSNTIFAWATKGKWTLENIVFDGINLGYGYKNGLLDSRISPVVDFKNIRMTDTLYVSSVWQDEDGTHLSVTNDTAMDRELLIFTDKGSYSYQIEAFDRGAEDAWSASYDSMPFDIKITIEEPCKYVVCYDKATIGSAKQIRFVNFEEDSQVYLDKALIDELTVSENDIFMSGSCGKNVGYTLTNGGVLTLSGNGATYEYHSQKFPEWYDYRYYIKEIVVEEGIERIGNAVFARTTAVEKITLPKSLRTIGQYAFDGCVCIDEVTLPPNLEQLGTGVFRGMQLKEIYYEGENWDAINISKGNDVLNNNTKYYTDGEVTYRIVYYLNDTQEQPASHDNPKAFQSGDEITFKPATRDGYTFDGWYANDGLTVERTGVLAADNQNIRVYAKWIENVTEPDNPPSESPDETPDNPPSETPDETPDNPPSETPDETPDNPPSESPDETPENPPSETPDETPTTPPSETPGQEPQSPPAQTSSGVIFKKAVVEVKPGKTVNNIKETPKNASVSYKSADKKIATVNKNGVVKGVNAGQTTIQATAGGITTVFVVKVAPKQVKSLKLKRKGTESLKISWKKDKKADGYQILMKTGKSGTYKVVKTIKKNKTVSFTKKKLRKGKTYYVRVRAYKVMGGKKVYGSYSVTKKLKLK